MTPSEWDVVCEQVKARWGSSSAWSQAHNLWSEVRNVKKEAAEEAVRDFFGEGRSRAPSPSEVVAVARRNSGEVVTAPGPEDCSHPAYGIVEEDPTHRIGICRVCHTEVRLGKHRLLTEGEIQDRRVGSQTRSEPY